MDGGGGEGHDTPPPREPSAGGGGSGGGPGQTTTGGGGVVAPPPLNTLYLRTRCKSHGVRKYKRRACSGNCKSGILMSGWVLRRGEGAQFNPRLSNKVPDGAERGSVFLFPVTVP